MVTKKQKEGLKLGRGWNKGQDSKICKICNLCQKPFYYYSSTNPRRRYCSRECAYKDRPHYKKKTEWTYRRVAEEHLDKKCVVCGVSGKLVVHHKDKNRNNNEIDNLEYRCYKHHCFGRKAIHPHPKNRLGIMWSEEMRSLISKNTRTALHKPETRKKHLSFLKSMHREGVNNPNYKNGRYCK